MFMSCNNCIYTSLHLRQCLCTCTANTEVIWLVKVHHQHWHQSSNVEGEACIDGREGDEEGVSGGQEEADRCRDVGRTAVVHRTQVIAQMQEAGKIAAALRLKYIRKLIIRF